MPPALCVMLPGAALGMLIMAVTWDWVCRARLVSVSGSGIAQRSGLHAVQGDDAAREWPGGRFGSGSGIEAAARGGQPAGHLVIAWWHPDRGLAALGL